MNRREMLAAMLAAAIPVAIPRRMYKPSRPGCRKWALNESGAYSKPAGGGMSDWNNPANIVAPDDACAVVFLPTAVRVVKSGVIGNDGGVPWGIRQTVEVRDEHGQWVPHEG